MRFTVHQLSRIQKNLSKVPYDVLVYLHKRTMCADDEVGLRIFIHKP